MTKLQVLVIGSLQDAPAFQLLRQHEVIRYKIESKEQLLKDFATTLKNISAIYAHFGCFSFVGGFRGEVLAKAPASLRMVAIPQIGYDEYDLPGMARRGIMLTNSPTSVAYEGVADTVLYNTLSAFRNFKMYDKFTNRKSANVLDARALLNSSTFDQITGTTIPGSMSNPGVAFTASGRPNRLPRGHNAVIVGFGGIGKAIGQRLSCIGMNIHYIKRTRLSEEEEKSLGYKVTYHQSLNDTTEFADLIIIACPGNAETKHMVNEKLIGSMRKQFSIINVGRGFVADENALVKGLKSGKINFAGLDVFEEEPIIHQGLIGREDVVLTPHCGSSTVNLRDCTLDLCFKNINEVLTGSNEVINKVI